MRIKSYISLISLIAIFLLAGCSKQPPELADKDISPAQLLRHARKYAENAEVSRSRITMKNLAKKGIKCSNLCIERSPETAGCYYFRAVNTGLYYKAKIIGYQKGLKQMLSDVDVLKKLDPTYEYGGAYRITGQIYSKVPKTAAKTGDITRDLELAEKNLKKATSIGKDYPENRLCLADVLYRLGDDDAARAELDAAVRQLNEWKSSPFYKGWKKLAKKLKKRLKVD